MTDNRDRSEAQFADGRALQPFPDDLPTLAEGLERLLSRVAERMKKRSRPVERVPLEAAHGRVLAQEVAADAAMPPFDRATMDGYAVRSEDIRGAAPGAAVELRLVGDVAAGEVAGAELSVGRAVAVATGSMLPRGADAVVPGEFCRLAAPTSAGDSAVEILKFVPPGGNVLPKGSDLPAGGSALAAGTRLGAPQIAVLATVGVVEPPVFVRPTVAIVATGDELVPASARPAPGQIRETNSYALLAAAMRDGAAPRRVGIVADDPRALSEGIARELGRADLILVSGGSSVGKTDYTRDVLTELGAEIILHGLKIKPGKPTLAALCRDAVIVGLPGNPVSASTIYMAFVRPVLHQLMGLADPPPVPTVTARLTRAIRRDPAREEFVRVRLRAGERGPEAEPVPGGSGMIYAMARAHGHVFIPMERQSREAGELVEVELFE